MIFWSNCVAPDKQKAKNHNNKRPHSLQKSLKKKKKKSSEKSSEKPFKSTPCKNAGAN